jgi:hypothetical protein
MLLPSLACGPGLQLVHGITGRIEVVVVNDLGQIGGVPAILPSVLQAPGLKFRVWTRRPHRRTWLKRNVAHVCS